MPKGQALTAQGCRGNSQETAGLVREAGTRPPRESKWTLARGIVFGYDCKGDAPPEVVGKKHNHLFYKSFKGGILKIASFAFP